MHISHIASLVAIIYLSVGLMLALGGAFVRETLARFPRNHVAGAVLAAIAIGWAATLFWNAPLGWFEPYRHTIPFIAAAVYLLTVLLVHELLAPRALGGLLLLVAAPVLNSIRWEPTDWRLVLTVQAYIWVIAGMLLVFSPYRFRRVCNRIYQQPGRPIVTGVLFAILGVFMGILAMTGYRS